MTTNSTLSPARKVAEAFINSAAYKDRPDRHSAGVNGPQIALDDIDVKTLMSTGAGFSVAAQREPGVITPIASRPLSFIDLIPEYPAVSDPVRYMEETTFTNGAAEVAESVQGALSTWGESAFAYTERSSDVGRVSTWLPVTDEQLDDAGELAAHLEQRLGFALLQRLEAQCLTGNGVAPNIRGILPTVGIGTQAKGADSVAVALRKGLTKVQTPGEAIPGAYVLNPAQSEALDTTAAADQLAVFEGNGDVWNLPRFTSTALTAGTALVGDFANFAALRVKRGITIQISNSHAGYFLNGVQAIRADMRVAFVVHRPAAFVTITGL